MKIKYICPFWGSDNLSAKGFIQKVVESGYDGVEVNSPDDSEFEKDILEAIKENNLARITSYNVCYTKLLRVNLYTIIPRFNYFLNKSLC